MSPESTSQSIDMTFTRKVSPAFEPVFAQSGPNDRHEAIIVYRVPASTVPPVRGRLRELKKRLDSLKARYRPIQAKVLKDYQEEGSKHLSKDQGIAVSTIGKSTLPLAWVEVTRSTLPALVAQPNVLAVLPNLKIRLSAVMQALKETAKHPGGPDLRPDNRWGYGVIRPVEALNLL